ncbi:exodeoxyribonuclease III [Aestuariirhabdus litorea]|uniref:Exodeoxyribonuclease III n=1 Tax=Aestuariirhabdus litorea TaxID=2528527 RepID=A0A3P3VVD4_9GAMM|nr:exodeoxyribonuclease III [Aestuariirhabdus litorea]RRJ84713.1 exodeoxyribonuclease III [Aestuariirhabdus litorea]RWW97938.1 exodeoxyribonuclease III [Endozoicomonadaceae bacterium GTF-13]
MKLVSFNVNGIRARLHQLQALVDRHQPDVIGIQESKVVDNEFPIEAIAEMGYHAEIHGQKGHYGVALLSRTAPLKVIKGFPGDEPNAQRRMIMAEYRIEGHQPLMVLNGYFPQGDNRSHAIKFPAKERFYADLQHYLETYHQPQERLLVMGDFNISPTDADIGIGPDNAKRWLRTGKCSFLPEEREWYQRLMGWGLEDCYRALHPDATDHYSWFDYRSRGFDDTPRRGLRIDTLLATPALSAQCTEALIDYEIRAMEKPSDHCPVIVHFAS